jgi:hypothetical protein
MLGSDQLQVSLRSQQATALRGSHISQLKTSGWPSFVGMMQLLELQQQR